jgi:hypothetical protein
MTENTNDDAPPTLASAFESGRDAALEILQRHFDGYQRIEDVAAALSSAYAEVNSLIAPSQRSAASSAEPAATPKRWLIEEMLPSGCIRWQTFEHEFQARSEARPLGAIVTPLYAAPTTSPSDGEVKSSTASSAEPVAIDDGSNAHEMIEEMVRQVKNTATPPSVGNADAVRGDIAKTIFVEGFGGTERSWDLWADADNADVPDAVKICWDAARALSLPAHGGWPTRNQIARTIFPNAFIDEGEKSPPIRLWTQAMQDAAFETADAVLALFVPRHHRSTPEAK